MAIRAESLIKFCTSCGGRAPKSARFCMDCGERFAEVSKRLAIPAKLRFQVLTRDDNTCVYCGRRPPDVVLHIDHVIPVASGGKNTLENLVTSCADCNRGKGASILRVEDLVAIEIANREERDKTSAQERINEGINRKMESLRTNFSGLEGVYSFLFGLGSGWAFVDREHSQVLKIASQMRQGRMPTASQIDRAYRQTKGRRPAGFQDRRYQVCTIPKFKTLLSKLESEINGIEMEATERQIVRELKMTKQQLVSIVANCDRWSRESREYREGLLSGESSFRVTGPKRAQWLRRERVKWISATAPTPTSKEIGEQRRALILNVKDGVPSFRVAPDREPNDFAQVIVSCWDVFGEYLDELKVMQGIHSRAGMKEVTHTEH